MKELSQIEFNMLLELYHGHSFNDMKRLYYLLRKIRFEVIRYPVLIYSRNQFVCDTLDELNGWIELNFPDMLHYFDNDSIPNAFSEKEFPRFKKRPVEIGDINRNLIRRIKKISVWGNNLKVRQNFQLVDEVIVSDDLITFCLSDDAFVQVADANNILDSDYSLIIGSAKSLEFKVPNTSTVNYSCVNGRLNTNSKVKFENSNCNSVLIDAIELFK